MHKAAKFYYYPGWHEPGTTLECFVNKDKYLELPEDLKSIILGASKMANLDMLCEMIAKNNEALKILQNKHNVDIRPYPEEVLSELYEISKNVVKELSLSSDFAKEVIILTHLFKKKLEIGMIYHLNLI